jgi:NAD(P)-dependent dehydrogenase (short-subunit alcohol dehydrogenase family)
VINASVNAMRPEVHFADYNASKAAAASLAATLAMEWSAEGLCVTCLSPNTFART